MAYNLNSLACLLINPLSHKNQSSVTSASSSKFKYLHFFFFFFSGPIYSIVIPSLNWGITVFQATERYPTPTFESSSLPESAPQHRRRLIIIFFPDHRNLFNKNIQIQNFLNQKPSIEMKNKRSVTTLTLSLLPSLRMVPLPITALDSSSGKEHGVRFRVISIEILNNQSKDDSLRKS